MTAAEVVAVIDRLEGGGVDVWVDGGWGIDALLGRQTRPHGDIDLVIGWSDLKCAERALAPLGFTHDTDAAPGLPARFVLRDAEGRQVDVHPVEFDASGHGWQDLGDGRRGRYAAAGLTGVGRIAGPSAASPRSFSWFTTVATSYLPTSGRISRSWPKASGSTKLKRLEATRPRTNPSGALCI